MSLEKLSRRVKREVSRSPKKSAILGIACLAAIYFWVPLLGDWMGGDDDTSEPNAAIASASGGGPLSPTPNVAAALAVTAQSMPAWENVFAWIESDPLMKPATLDAGRDPFAMSVKAPPSMSSPVASVKDVGPEQLGIQLTGTFVVGSNRLATINGSTYRLKDQIRVSNASEDTAAIYFRVIEIRPRQVVLSRNGKRFELTIPLPDLARGDRIGRG